MPLPVDPLEELVEFTRARIGSALVDRAVLESRLAAQPACLAIERSALSQISAYTLVYALTTDATRRVLECVVVAGRDLQPEDLAADGDARALYIAAVVGAQGGGVGAIGLLSRHLSTQLQQHPSATILFARGATASGSQLLDRFGFQALEKPSEIRTRPLDEGLRGTLGASGATARRIVATLARQTRQLRPNG